MMRGLYTAASGMIAQQRRHDIITNNIANINTPGFKQGNPINRSFPEVLIETMGAGNSGAVQIGRMNTGVLAEESVSLHAQGDVMETGNTFDFALVSNMTVPGAQFDASGKYVDENGNYISQPQAFFTIVNEAGEQRYTLNGKFSVDVNGQLITSEGYQVLSRSGEPIVLLEQGTREPISNFRITKTGLFTDIDGQALLNANNEPMSLLVTRIEDPNQLVREGNGLYLLHEQQQGLAQPVELTDQVEVKQGYIERSNVDTAQATVDLMSAMRAYEANQRVIQYYDRSMDKAANEIGKV